MKPYKKNVSHLFEAGGEFWEVTLFGKEWLEFTEVSKNGQEDTHMSGFVELKDGKWVLDSDSRRSIDTYGPGYEVLEAFFNTHGVPCDDNTNE